jgi:hypothetical protein
MTGLSGGDVMGPCPKPQLKTGSRPTGKESDLNGIRITSSKNYLCQSKPFMSIFTYLLAAPHHLVLWLVKASKPFTLAVSASPSAARKGNIMGETGASDKTLSKR